MHVQKQSINLHHPTIALMEGTLESLRCICHRPQHLDESYPKKKIPMNNITLQDLFRVLQYTTVDWRIGELGSYQRPILVFGLH